MFQYNKKVLIQLITFYIKMKSEKETSITLDDSIFIDQNNKHIITCISGNQAFEYCIKDSCKNKRIFLCDKRKCQCRQQHELCQKADLDATIKYINMKIIDTKQISEYVQKQFDKIIDQISQIRDKILTSMNQKIKYINLHKIQKQFLHIIYSNNDFSSSNIKQSNKNNILSHSSLNNIKQNFTSKESSELFNIITKKYAGKYDIFQEIKNQIKKLQIFLIQNTKQTPDFINTIISKQQLVQVNLLPLYQFFRPSSILTQHQDISKLQQFFNKNITNASLVFKASQHQFNLKKYYQLCGDIANTMIICKTNKDKIIGGYSPLSFNPTTNKMQYITDQSSQSMIFSITQNDKFQLKDRTKAIRHMPDKSHVRIGNAQFDICDKGDTNLECYTYLTNQFYGNAKYKNDKDSYLRLTGNESFKFSTKQWQVWKLQFSQEQKKQQNKKKQSNIQSNKQSN